MKKILNKHTILAGIFLGISLIINQAIIAQGGKVALRKNNVDHSLKLGYGTILKVAQNFPYNSYNSADFFYPPYYSESDRMGYGKTAHFDTSSFNAGWYTDWQANIAPEHPGASEYIRTIYFYIHDTGSISCNEEDDINEGFVAPATMASQVTANLTDAEIVANVQKNPGALWIVGNEPDAPYNGSPIEPTLYAELYHHYYTIIKNADPTAKIAIGAVSQPSPIRRIFLDKILTHYKSTYGQDLPTDLWNIHTYYLNEQVCQWGVSLPPSGDDSQAWVLTTVDIADGRLIDLQAMETHIREFRQWMYDRGYGNTPLIVTEYGVLPPPETGYGVPYSNEKSAQFLHDTTNMFQSLTDSTTGYPADGYRLVQMWNWFSTRTTGFGGNLFDEFGNVSVVGQAFSSETNGGFTPYADMQLIMESYTQTNTSIDVDAYAQNRGNSAASNVQTSVMLADATSGQVVGEKTIDWGTVNRRYQDEPISLAHTWQLTGTQTITVPYNLIVSVSDNDDVDVTNNTYTTQVNWSPVVNMVISETNFSTGNPFKFTEPVTLTITATIINRGNYTTTATTADIIANGSDVLLNNASIPTLAPMAQYQITTTKYISSMIPLKILVKINSLENYELEPENTHMETTLLYESVYLPLIMR